MILVQRSCYFPKDSKTINLLNEQRTTILWHGFGTNLIGIKHPNPGKRLIVRTVNHRETFTGKNKSRVEIGHLKTFVQASAD